MKAGWDSHLWDSNPRPMLYESIALPAELRRHRIEFSSFGWGWAREKGGAQVRPALWVVRIFWGEWGLSFPAQRFEEALQFDAGDVEVAGLVVELDHGLGHLVLGSGFAVERVGAFDD